MRKYWKSVVIVLLVLAGLAWFALDLVKERAAMTGSASARVTKVAFDPDQESSSLDETDISYEYEVEAKRVASTSSLPGAA